MNKQEWPKLEVEQNCQMTQVLCLTRQILSAINKGQLISDGADLASAKYACYEIHIGPCVKQLVVDHSPESESDLYRDKNIPEDGVFRIHPSETFKIYSVEELYLPADVFAITIPVGNMYKLGLNPETPQRSPKTGQ